MENLPLWVWAIVVGLIIVEKYAYRWRTNEKVIDSRKSMTDSATKFNTSGVGIAISHKYSHHKYSPSSYRDYFEIRKRKGKKSSM